MSSSNYGILLNIILPLHHMSVSEHDLQLHHLSSPKSPVKSKVELHMDQFILLSRQLLNSQLKHLRKKDKPILAPKAQFTLDTCILYSNDNMPSHNKIFFQYWTLELIFFFISHYACLYIFIFKNTGLRYFCSKFFLTFTQIFHYPLISRILQEIEVQLPFWPVLLDAEAHCQEAPYMKLPDVTTQKYD